MKNILIVLLLLTGLTVQAQKYTGVFKLSKVNSNPKNEYSDWGPEKNINLHFTLDLDEKSVSINNDMMSVYELKEKVETVSIPDKDGDTTTVHVFKGTDEDGIKCLIKIRMWKEYNIFQLYVFYSDVHFLFSGELDIYYP
jgi:hypothetical protein